MTLQRLKENARTVIVISHKQGLLADADKLLVLDSGKMLTFGAKDEVLKALWKPQVVSTQSRAAEAGTMVRER
jgi:ABC-type protease/lipase transport system fused ATPase/permease subunit